MAHKQRFGKWVTREEGMLTKETACAKVLRGETARHCQGGSRRGLVRGARRSGGLALWTTDDSDSKVGHEATGTERLSRSKRKAQTQKTEFWDH